MDNTQQPTVAWLLEKTNAQALAQLLKRWPMLLQAWEKGGFKLVPQSFENPALRTRLLFLLLQKDAPTESFLMDIADLKTWKPLQEAWKALSQDWLAQNWRAFLKSLPDPRPWCMAIIWWGDSDKMKRLAELLSRCRALWQEPPADRQPGALLPMLQCFTPAAKNITVKDSQNEQLHALREKHTAAKQQLEQLRRENKQLSQQLTDELSQCQHALKQQEHVFLARERKLQAENAAICANAEEKTRVALDNFQQMALGIHPDLLAFTQNLSQEEAALEKRLEAALQKQADTNLRYGLKRELRDEVLRLEEYLSQIRLAIDEAITISPELPVLQREIENRLAQVYEKLHEDPEQLSLAIIPTRLKSLIKTVKLDAGAQAKFSDLRKFLENDHLRQLLLPDENAAVRTLLEQRCQLHLSVQSSQDIARTKPLSHSHTQLIWSLAAFINDLHRVVLYVDAYNVIIGDKAWKAIKDKKGLLHVRQEFLNSFKAKASVFRQVNLVYDGGSTLSSVENFGNIVVHFAPSLQADQNADDYIVKSLRENPKDQDTLRWVVTDDVGLQNRCKESCDALVAAFCLNQFLRLS